MRRLVVLFCLFLLCIQEIYAQQQVSDELRAYNDYLLSLSCYKASGELNMAIGEKFMEGDIAGVRRLSAEREKLLMQSIDSVLAFRADAKKSEAAAQLVTRLVFNLGFENTGKVLNRFEPGFDPLCLQEVRQSLEKESKVRPGMPAADFKVFDREGKEYTLASFKGKYIFLEFSASWCSWCKKEIPSIRQAYERFKDLSLIHICWVSTPLPEKSYSSVRMVLIRTFGIRKRVWCAAVSYTHLSLSQELL